MERLPVNRAWTLDDAPRPGPVKVTLATSLVDPAQETDSDGPTADKVLDFAATVALLEAERDGPWIALTDVRRPLTVDADVREGP